MRYRPLGQMGVPHLLRHWAIFKRNKAIVQARMLSGRYRTEALCSHWTSNKAGHCLLYSCKGHNIKDDITHILVECESLSSTRNNMKALFSNFMMSHTHTIPVLQKFFLSTDATFQTQFLLDCSILPDIIILQQTIGHQILDDLFYLTRSWCYAIHRERLKNLNRWNPQ